MGGDGNARLKVSPVCSRLGHSRQVFYKDRVARRRKAVDEGFVVDAVARARLVHPRCGTRKLLRYTREDLARAGMTVGRDRFFEILRTHDMLVKRRRAFVPHTTKWDESLPVSRNLLKGRIVDGSNLMRIVHETDPDEVYNLAAQSHVRVSFDSPEFTGDVDALGTMRLLEAIRLTGVKTRFYQASTSELFGKVQEVPQRETTPFYPRSPYGVAKLYSFWAVKNYREAYGIHASNGILFNHESPRRGETFVTRKITRAASRIKMGLQEELYMGNVEARRDWGFAGDYVEGMWRMLQQDNPDDYVLATGEMHSVKEFLSEAFGYVGLDWEKYTRHDTRYDRPSEVEQLLGDPTKAKKVLGWEPKVTFKGLVKMMMDADMELAEKELKLK